MEVVLSFIAGWGNKLDASMKRATLEVLYILPHVVNEEVGKVLSCLAGGGSKLEHCLRYCILGPMW